MLIERKFGDHGKSKTNWQNAWKIFVFVLKRHFGKTILWVKVKPQRKACDENTMEKSIYLATSARAMLWPRFCWRWLSLRCVKAKINMFNLAVVVILHPPLSGFEDNNLGSWKRLWLQFTCARPVFVFCRDVSDSCLMYVSDIKADLAAHGVLWFGLVCFFHGISKGDEGGVGEGG